jgi:lysyl endopeptidase
MKNKVLFFILLAISISLSSYSQISKPIKRQSIVKKVSIPKSIKKSMNDIDMDEIKKQDIADSIAGRPPRFGYPFLVDYNLTNSGKWVDLENGGRIWFLTIECPKAKSINLLYDSFWLPPNSTLHIYNNDTTQILGAFTENNNKGTVEKPKGFSTGLVIGNTITLEYYEPKEVINQGIISISRVVHGHRYIGPLRSLYKEFEKDYGDGGICNRNINCSEGADWQDEKQSVAVLLHNGVRWCTGSLLNNTSNDGSLYFLSADHCIDGSGAPIEPDLDAIDDPGTTIDETDGSMMSFYWNYESPDCSNGVDFTPPSTSGATVIANNSYSDFALFLLDESPVNVGVNPYLNGWDRNNTAASSAVGIHHPNGDIKKICVENNALTSTTYYGTTVDNSANHWRVADWDVGVTETGSSGSPLFNQNSRVIGQLHGGGAACRGTTDNGSSDWYGKFSTSWDYGSSAQRRLSDWLDPSSIGSTTINGRFLSDCEETVISNRTITSDETIDGCDIKVENVTIQNNSVVIIDATNNVIIEKNFEVKVGSTLEIK